MEKKKKTTLGLNNIKQFFQHSNGNTETESLFELRYRTLTLKFIVLTLAYLNHKELTTQVTTYSPLFHSFFLLPSLDSSNSIKSATFIVKNPSCVIKCKVSLKFFNL
jgi:hypothetical protein